MQEGKTPFHAQRKWDIFQDLGQLQEWLQNHQHREQPYTLKHSEQKSIQSFQLGDQGNAHKLNYKRTRVLEED